MVVGRSDECRQLRLRLSVNTWKESVVVDYRVSNGNKAVWVVKTVIGVFLCLVFVPLLAVNFMLIVKGYISPNEVPSIFGYSPIIEASVAMDGGDAVKMGDLLFIDRSVNAGNVEIGDVVAIRINDSVVIRRLTEIRVTESGVKRYRTLGDNADAETLVIVDGSQIIGGISGRVGKIGAIILFSQTPLGLILCIGGPAIAFVIYDTIRVRKEERQEIMADPTARQTEQCLPRLKARSLSQAKSPRQ